MVIATVGNFMPPLGHLSDDFRRGVGNPAQDKKRGFDVKLVQEFERFQGTVFKSRFETVPFPMLDDPVEGANLEIILEPNRQQMRFWCHSTNDIHLRL
jgi:hypothetical protein